jgi:hypothetical protein
VADETNEILAEQEQATEERPPWLPQNFKSPEDLANSYKAAQAKLTQTEQELSGLKSKVDEILAEQEQARAQAQYGQVQGQLVETWESGDAEQQLATMAWLAQEAAKAAIQQYVPPSQPNPALGELIAAQADQVMRSQYEDYDELRSDIANVIQSNPTLMQISDAPSVQEVQRGLATAYQIAKAQKVLSAAGTVREAEAEVARATKNAAQTITGASQRPATMSPQEEAWEAIKNAASGGIRLGRI